MTRRVKLRERAPFRCEVLEARQLLAGDLVSHWLAHDLTGTLNEGDTVEAWTDNLGQVSATKSFTGNPTFKTAAVGGRAAISFDASDGSDVLKVVAADSPMKAAGDFTISVVFATSANDLRGEGDDWFRNSGLVDGSQQGFSTGWGVSINTEGQVLAGVSDGFQLPNTTVSSAASGLNDGQTHTLFYTKSGSDLSLFVDDQVVDTQAGASVRERSGSIGVAIGGLFSGNGDFSGEIAEVRVYNGALTPAEVSDVRAELISFYNNTAPVAQNDVYTMSEDPVLGFSVQAASGVLANDSDADGDSLTAEIVEPTANGRISLRPDGSFIYFPEKDFFGTASFTYAAVDFRPSNVATVTIEVTPVYDPVQTTPDSYKARPTDVLNIPAFVGLLTNDTNPDQVERRVILADDVSAGDLTLNEDGSFSYDPQGFSGVATFTYQVDDGTQTTAAETVELVVNTPPVATDDVIRGDEDQVFSDLNAALLGNDVDADGNELTVSVIETTTQGELTIGNDGILSYTPNADYFGEDRFTYQLTDGVDPSNIATALFNVNPVNDAPVGVADAFFGRVGEVIEATAAKGLLSNDLDIDSEGLTVALVSGPANGELTLNADGSFSYQPNPGFDEIDSFSYQTSDGALMSQPTEVQLFVGGAPVRISEIMVANVTGPETRTIAEVGDRFRGEDLLPDWIEIQNLSTSDFDISGFHLSDDRFDSQKWQVPDGFIVPAAGYAIVYATQLNVVTPELDETNTLHTNFGLSINGETISIADPDGNLLFDLDYPNQYPDVAYGFTPDGDLNYLLEPTLGADNVGGYLGITGDTSFSVDRGFYTEPIQVEISATSIEEEIRFTLDGSQPSPENGSVYAGPITIDGTTTVRAATFRDGYLTPNVDTQTYIYLDQVIQQSSTPEVGPSDNRTIFPDRWGNQASDYEVDPNITNDPAYSDQIHSALTALPSLTLSLAPEDLFDRTGLYSRPGSTTEESASAELLFPDGSEVGFQIDAGARMQGGASRNAEHLKHSMSLRFREDYGDSSLDYPLFEDSPVSNFEAIHLRARYNNSWIHWDQGQRNRGTLMRERWMRDTMLAAGEQAAGHGRYVHLYLNGLYWGIYEMHERQDASHYASYYGGDSNDYAATNAGVTIDGTADSWQNLSTVVRSGDWEETQKVLDVDNHILYNIVQRFGGNQDLKTDGNWRTAGGGTANAPWQFYVWDSERVLESVRQNRTSPVSDLLGFSRILNDNPEYQIRFADHLHRLFFNGGALTPEATAGRWTSIAAELETAIIAESARWGDARTDRGQRGALTKNDHWLPEQQRLLNDYFPERSDNVLDLFVGDDLYPQTAAPEFLINGARQHGGTLNEGETLSVLNPGNVGTIYYTTDGTDPRLAGGDLSDGALIYDGASIPIQESALVRMRIRNDQEWSAMSEATFVAEAIVDATNLRISEINYHPHNPLTEFGEVDQVDNAFEFIELVNTSNSRVNLSGVELRQKAIDGNAEGVNFVFAPQTLEPQQRIVVVRDREAFEQRYGDALAIAAGNDGVGGVEGQWSGGRLSDGGETVTLFSQGEEILSVTYSDGGNWPGRADGDGSSLEILDPAGDPNDGNNWRSSRLIGGTPGTVFNGPVDQVVINEVLANSAAPAVDQMELFNAGANTIDISNWYLSDSAGNLTKYQFEAGSSIAPSGYTTIDQNALGFGFDGQSSDDAWLIAADETGRPIRFVDSVRFGASEEGTAFGRWPNGQGELFPMVSSSFGTVNSGPVVPTVFISEVHYNPRPLDEGQLTADTREFIEISNAGPATDISGWQIDRAVDFTFATNQVIATGASLVIVSFDPTDVETSNAFRAQYGIDDRVELLGPYRGVLDNGGERTELQRPLDSDFILVDRVRYDDTAPWAVQADGAGSSLQRVSNSEFGNLSASWLAATPTPGAFEIPDLTGDLDENGVLDSRDIDHFCRNRTPDNPIFDLNGDGQIGDDADYQYFITNIFGTNLGDSNLDGQFSSRDLVRIFTAGEYQDETAGNSTWEEGDWTCDGDFDTSDLVAAFQAGAYQVDAASVRLIAGAVSNLVPDSGLELDRAHDEIGDRSEDTIESFAKRLDAEVVDSIFLDNGAATIRPDAVSTTDLTE